MEKQNNKPIKEDLFYTKSSNNEISVHLNEEELIRRAINGELPKIVSTDEDTCRIYGKELNSTNGVFKIKYGATYEKYEAFAVFKNQKIVYRNNFARVFCGFVNDCGYAIITASNKKTAYIGSLYIYNDKGELIFIKNCKTAKDYVWLSNDNKYYAYDNVYNEISIFSIESNLLAYKFKSNYQECDYFNMNTEKIFEKLKKPLN